MKSRSNSFPRTASAWRSSRPNACGPAPAGLRPSAADWRGWLLLLVAAAALLACTGCSSKRDDGAPANDTTAHNVTLTPAQQRRIRLLTVAPADFHDALEATATVDFDNDQATSVLAPFSGPVTRLLAAPGDTVAKGQPLAAVASPDFAAAVSAYRKALVTANNARRLATMDQDLVKHDGIAAREAQQAQTDAVSAEADREAALQALVALDIDPQTIRAIRDGRPAPRVDGLIRAPVAGTVVDRLITPGQLLQAGSTACFTVANLSRMWVMAQIAPADLGKVQVGDAADVIVDGDAPPLHGSVTNIATEVNPDTGLVAARVEVANPQRRLKRQMYVDVRIHSRLTRRGILVPVAAVLRDEQNLPFVYLAQPDGSFARQHVTLGSRIGDDDAIDAGLQPGARVVVDGGLFVQFMQNQ